MWCDYINSRSLHFYLLSIPSHESLHYGIPSESPPRGDSNIEASLIDDIKYILIEISKKKVPTLHIFS